MEYANNIQQYVLNINLICLHKKKDISEDLKSIHFSDKILAFDIDDDKAFDDTISILKNIDILIFICQIRIRFK
jgi:hypothetical protein